MKTEEIKKQDELNDEQLDNVAGASRITDIIKDILKDKYNGDDMDIFQWRCQGIGSWHTRLSKIINKKNKYYY